MNDTKSKTANTDRPMIVPRHGRGRIMPWKKGQSGNPAGQTDAMRNALLMARTNTPSAVATLIALHEDVAQDPRVRAVAANAILDRAMGKPKEPCPVTPEHQQIDLRDCTEEELEILERVLRRTKQLGNTSPFARN